MNATATASKAALKAVVKPAALRCTRAPKCSCGAEYSNLTGECPHCVFTERQKLEQTGIDEPAEGFEREAEQVAEEFAGQPADGMRAQPRIQRLQSARNSNREPPNSVRATLRTAGATLPPALRLEMEQYFGQSLAAVRVHAGSDAERSTRELNASAYTIGNDIVFGAGQYAPGTRQGKRLLAHELTHVVQQSGAPAAIQRSPRTAFDAPPRSGPDGMDPSVGMNLLTTADPQPDAVAQPAPPAAPGTSDAPLSPQRRAPSKVVSRRETGAARSTPAPMTDGEAAEAPVTDDAGKSAAPRGEATAGGETSLPHLADMLPVQSEIAPEAMTPDEARTGPRPALASTDDSRGVTPAGLKVFVDQLRTSAVLARRAITGHSAGARFNLKHRSDKAKERVDAEVEHANGLVKGMITKRRDQLELTLGATQFSIETQRTVRKEEVEQHGQDAKLELAYTVSQQRGKIERAIEKWAGYVDSLRELHTQRVQEAVAENARIAIRKGELYDQRFISTQSRGPARAAVQREASSALAKALAEEFRKSEPLIIAELKKNTGQMAGEVREYGDKSLVEFDKVLPKMLNGIDDQVAAAKESIDGKAREALARLAVAARSLRARLDFLEKESLGRNATAATDTRKKIESSQKSADAEYHRAVPLVMKPIGGVVIEAIDLLTTSGTLDFDASSRFVGEITTFANEASVESETLFLETHEGVAEAFQRPAPAARRAMALVRKDLAGILREEGSAAELKLVEFELGVDENYAASITSLDETFEAGRGEATRLLAPVTHEVWTAFEKAVMDAAPKLQQAVNDALYEQILGLRRLPSGMHQVAREAAWRFDHPQLKYVRDAVEWIGMALAVIFIAIAAVVALILAIEAIVAALTAFLAYFVGQALAALIAEILVVAAGGFAAGYFGAKAYHEAREKGMGPGMALLSAIGEVTGVSGIYRVFADSSLNVLERGLLLGTSVLSVVGLAFGAAKIFKSVKLRFPSKITDPRAATAMSLAGEAPRVEIPKIEPPAPVVGEVAQGPRVEGFGRGPEPVVPEAPVTPSKRVDGFGRKPEPVEPVAPEAPVTPSKRVDGFGRKREPVEPMAPEAPVTPSKRVDGFGRKPEPIEPVTPDAPVAPSKRVDGFGRKPEPVEPVVPAQVPQTPVAKTPMPAPREVPSGPAAPQGAQDVRASGGPRDTPPPKSSSPTGPEPVRGKVEPTPEKLPDEVIPEAPAAPKTKAEIDAEVEAINAKIAVNNQKIAENADALKKAQEKVNKLNDEFTDTPHGGDYSDAARAQKRLKNKARKKLDDAKEELREVEQVSNDARAANRQHHDEIYNLRERPLSTYEKGNVGEKKAHEFMDKEEGFDFVGSSKKPLMEKTPAQDQGLDGVYRNRGEGPPKNVVGEAKYDEGKLTSEQRTPEWVDDRLDQAVGFREAERLRDQGYEYWELNYNPRSLEVTKKLIFRRPPRKPPPVVK